MKIAIHISNTYPSIDVLVLAILRCHKNYELHWRRRYCPLEKVLLWKMSFRRLVLAIFSLHQSMPRHTSAMFGNDVQATSEPKFRLAEMLLPKLCFSGVNVLWLVFRLMTKIGFKLSSDLQRPVLVCSMQFSQSCGRDFLLFEAFDLEWSC